jgi:hypothetical protein
MAGQRDRVLQYILLCGAIDTTSFHGDDEVDEQHYGKLIDIAPPHEGKKKKAFQGSRK